MEEPMGQQKPKPSVYEIPIEELVERFGEACARSGTSSSGLVFDPGAGYHVIEVHYLRGALLARFANVSPPFKSQDQVRIRKMPGGHFSVGGYSQPIITPNEINSVDRV